jgi:hypothetical protein
VSSKSLIQQHSNELVSVNSVNKVVNPHKDNYHYVGGVPHNMKLITNLHLVPKLMHGDFTCYLVMCVSIKYIENESKSYDKTDFRDNIYCNQSFVNI